MAQFDVCRNPNAGTATRVPYLLDVQHDLIAVFESRAIVPRVDPALVRETLVQRRLPVFTIIDRRLVRMPQSITGRPARTPGPAVAALAGQRAELLAALDLLFTGI
ncbi:CcdB family protein [Plasticicumulans sp.]|uniref:CcdB family protein n=1 Tax=Plasticicumulans sp. TaxID=2307179 RepID=UPI00321F9246